MKLTFPKATRPLEFVAFFNIRIPTQEGPAYVFLACDAYSELGFNLTVEANDGPDSVMKSIHLLTEHPDFVQHINKGFTLVLDDFEELSEKITTFLKPINGKLLYDHSFNQQIKAPMIRSLSGFINQ